MLNPRQITATAPAEDREAAMLAATLDHLETQSRGGTHDPTNLRVCCTRCNNLRDDIPYEIFFEFALCVLRKHPDAPIFVLRSALKRFVVELAVLGMTNNQMSRRLAVLAATRVEQELKGKNMRWASRPAK